MTVFSEQSETLHVQATRVRALRVRVWILDLGRLRPARRRRTASGV